MALIFDIDAYSRKSRRHGTSGRRRTTASYDKYGYQIATVATSSGTEPVMHILRVRPGVVVNFIETPSRSSRSSRSRTSSYTVEYRPNTHKSSRKPDDERESSWQMTHSPHPHSLELFDEGMSHQPYGMVEADPRPEPPAPMQRPTLPPPSAHFASGAHPPPASPPAPYLSQETPYSTPPFEPYREQSVPVDIPAHARYSDLSHHSPSTGSSTSVSVTAHHEHAIEPYYRTARPMPAPIDVPIPSGRDASRSLDYPSHSRHSSEPDSPPSATRTVRFNDDPVQPSPCPVVRRKGWWNQRGDQLWDNDGAYAPAPEHDKYPLDLQNYPEPGVGWMNEEGVQIDMKRRLVRKKPLRSALKKPSSSL